MSTYRRGFTRLWNDKDIMAMNSHGKLLFLYFITNKLINNSGVYEIPIQTISHETAIPPGVVKKLLGNGTMKNVLYDEKNEMVFVKNARKYHPGGNPKQVQVGIVREFTLTAKTPLWNDFMLINPEFKDIFTPTQASLDTPSPEPEQAPEETPIEKDVLEVLGYLNERAGKDHRPNEQNKSVIRARLKDYSIDECKIAIDNKTAAWKGSQRMDEFLRPITLFCKSKFDGYRNATPKFGSDKQTPGEAKRQQIQQLIEEGAAKRWDSESEEEI